MNPQPLWLYLLGAALFGYACGWKLRKFAEDFWRHERNDEY